MRRDGDSDLVSGEAAEATLPRKALDRVSRLPVPETDTGRLPEHGKARGRILAKELGKLAPYVRQEGVPSEVKGLAPGASEGRSDQPPGTV